VVGFGVKLHLNGIDAVDGIFRRLSWSREEERIKYLFGFDALAQPELSAPVPASLHCRDRAQPIDD
jgi:hypothetical protein